MSNPVYDVAILGCGEAGIFAAYELSRLHPGLKLLALDQGRDIYHRNCPIVAGKVTSCIQCPVCDPPGRIVRSHTIYIGLRRQTPPPSPDSRHLPCPRPRTHHCDSSGYSHRDVSQFHSPS